MTPAPTPRATMVEIKSDNSSYGTYLRYVALAQVGENLVYPIRVDTYQQGAYEYANLYVLQTSANGTTSSPDATTLYEILASGDTPLEYLEDSIQELVESMRASASCTFDEAQAMWAANGTPKEIVYAD